MPKNWKYIKKLLEKEFLCESLRGHVTYDLTDYRPAPWYQQHFIMKYDDEVLLNVNQPQRQWGADYPFHEPRYWETNYIVKAVCKKYENVQHGIAQDMIERLTASVVEETCKFIAHYEGFYGVQDIIENIGIYLHSDIQSSLKSDEPFLRVLAILDRRTGKRTLRKLAEEKYLFIPAWVKKFYRLRFEAEGIRYSRAYAEK